MNVVPSVFAIYCWVVWVGCMARMHRLTRTPNRADAKAMVGEAHYPAGISLATSRGDLSLRSPRNRG